MTSLLEKLTALAQQAVASANCELVDLQYVKDGQQWFLRLFVERMGGDSPGLDDCVRVSDAMEGLLDVSDPLPHPYRLEVSSPGLGRVLKKKEDFIRFSGKLIGLQTLHGFPSEEDGAKRRNFKGVLEGMEGENVVVVVKGTRLAIPFVEIGKANLELEF